jgi:hypothetical protein
MRAGQELGAGPLAVKAVRALRAMGVDERDAWLRFEGLGLQRRCRGRGATPRGWTRCAACWRGRGGVGHHGGK